MKNKNELKESVPMPGRSLRDGEKVVAPPSPQKAASGRGRSFEELLSSLEEKVARFLRSLLGEESRVVSLGPGGNWVLDSPKYDKLVSVVVLSPSRVKVQYLSSTTSNVLFVEESKAYVRPTPLLEERLEKEYKELLVSELFDGASPNPSSPKFRVVSALNRLNFKPKAGKILVGFGTRGPTEEFVRRVVFSREQPYANRVFLGHFPNGISVILGYRDRANLVLFFEVFVEGEGGKVKQRILESLTKKKFEKIVQAMSIISNEVGEKEE